MIIELRAAFPPHVKRVSEELTAHECLEFLKRRRIDFPPFIVTIQGPEEERKAFWDLFEEYKKQERL